MIDLGCVARQIRRGENRTKKQPGAEFTRNKIGVLALLAQSRGLRQRLLHHGGGIDEYFHLCASCGDQPARQHLQPLLDHVVIIVALRID